MTPLLALGLPSGSEWILIGILALVFFGPDKIPQLARSVGKSLNEFKKAREDFERDITQDPPPKPHVPPAPQKTLPVAEKPVEPKPLELRSPADSISHSGESLSPAETKSA